MSLEYLHVDTSAMKSDCSKLRESKTDLMENFKTLFSEIESIDEMWEGPAKEAFVSSVRQDKVTCDEFASAIESYIQQMEAACQEYEKCENELHDYIENLNI